MPQVKCPNCGVVRLVVEGKRKKCRKCGTPLTSRPPKPEPEIPKVTVDELKEQYPEQIAEIVEVAKTEVVKEEIGELTSEILLEVYPELIAELTAAAKETAAKETAKAIAKETAEKVRDKIGKMNIKKFAEQFGELYEKIVNDARKPDKKEPNPPKGGMGSNK